MNAIGPHQGWNLNRAIPGAGSEDRWRTSTYEIRALSTRDMII
jgi:hypothetical protein